MEHDNATDTLVGAVESHRLTSLSQMFHVIAQQVKKATAEATTASAEELDDDDSNKQDDAYFNYSNYTRVKPQWMGDN